MRRLRLKKSGIFAIYGISIVILLSTIFIVEGIFFRDDFKDKDDYDYVTKTVFDDEVPVVNIDKVVTRPYIDTKIKVLKSFYDYKGEESIQENSILINGDTYLQNSGVVYGGTDNFDVVAILDGTVIAVQKDNLLGNVVQIRHTNDVISVYQSLGEVSVKENDVVEQGHIIGKSGTSNLDKSLGSHLLFELIIKGQTVNPESYYDKKVDEL